MAAGAGSVDTCACACAQVKYEEMVVPGMEDAKSGRGLSKTQRGQVWPPEAYASIWRAALSGMKSPLLGVSGRPIIVGIVFDPHNGGAMRGALTYNTTPTTDVDFRCLAFPADSMEEWVG